MDLQIGDVQETALITLAIRASETARPNARRCFATHSNMDICYLCCISLFWTGTPSGTMRSR